MKKKAIKRSHFLILFGLFLSFQGFSQFNIGSSGNIGIGITTPVSPLHVFADLPNWYPMVTSEVSNQDGINLSLLWNQGNGNIAENIYAVGDGWMMVRKGIWNGSDSILKINVSAITNPLAKIESLKGINFMWKPDTSLLHTDTAYTPDSTMHFGFIAQAVLRAFPGQKIAQKMHDSTYAVNYCEVIPILVEAVKAQQSEITLGEDSLKTKIQNLKDSLGSQVATLKTSLQISKDSIALLQTEENNISSRVLTINDSLRTVITLMQTQENNTALRVELVNDSNRSVITALQTQENNTAIRMEFIKDSLAWQTVQLQFLTANILNSIRQMRDSLIATFACNCNGTGGGTPDDARFGGSLGQNSPNPFNSQTTITYSLTGSITSASINVYNTEGVLELTTNLTAQAGSGYIKVSANSLSPGTYIYNLVVNNVQVDSKEMVITN